MEFYCNIQLVGHVNGYYFRELPIPVEVCVASVKNFKDCGKFFELDLCGVTFSYLDKLRNTHYAEKYLGLDFPPTKRDNCVNLCDLRKTLHLIHKALGSGLIGCVGQKQTDFFLQNGLPSINMTAYVPPYEDLEHLPLNFQHVHKEKSQAYCSINFARRYAYYLHEKSFRQKSIFTRIGPYA